MEMMDIVRIAAISLSLIVSTSSCQSRPGRLLADKVDAYDLSSDKQQLALLSEGKLFKMKLDGADQHVLNSSVFAPGYMLPDVKWSSNGLMLAVSAFYYSSGNRSLKVVDPTAKTSREISSRISGYPEWYTERSGRLAWIQPGPQRGQGMTRILVWSQLRGYVTIYEKATLPGASISWLKWIPRTDCLGFIGWHYPGTKHTGRPICSIYLISSDGSEFSVIEPPPGKFTPPHRNFRCWDASPSGRLIAYAYGGGIWTTSILPGSKPNKISDYWPLELRWSPDGKRLLFVTTTPDSRHATPVAPGSQVVAPPHELHLINLDGTGHQSVCIEKSGIKSIEWIDNREVLYLSGRSLYRNTL